MSRSPWNNPVPVFKEMPESNPKTGKPVVLFLCTQCGAVVANRKVHANWHDVNSWVSPF